MALKWPSKDPDAELDYSVDWSGWLTGGDFIVSSTWIVPADFTQPYAASFTTTSTTIWLAGGTADTDYELVNRITTDGNRIQDQTIRIKCKQR